MKFFNLTSVLLLAALSTFAQSGNNEDEEIKIVQYAGREYCEGEMIVKFKSSSEVRVRSLSRGVTSDVKRVDQVFSNLGVSASEQLMPLTGSIVSQAKARRSLSGKIVEDVDLNQLYCLRFDESKTNMLDAIEKISALDEVEYAEPNYIVRTLTVGEGSEVYDTAEEVAAYQAEPLYPQQWGLPAINMPQLWAQSKITSKRPVIAILDTGVDTTHPDLVDNLWMNTAEAEGEDYVDDDGNGYVDDVHGWDVVRSRGATDDPHGHGTHCAGIAAAVGNNGIGITGTNPDALIMSVRVLNDDGWGTNATVIKGIDYAIANGADVISMSLGGGPSYSLAEFEACKKAFQTAILVAAAGNNSCNIDCLIDIHPGRFFPGAYDVVIGVQATDTYGNRASFSNYDHDGEYYTNYDKHGDNFFNYEVYAPGVDIMSTYPGGKYKSLSGTSMATPFVAGVVSRLLQTKERERYLGTLVGDIVHACDESTRVLDAYQAHLFDNTNRQLEVVIQNVEISDAGAGDNDGLPESGEIIDLYPTVRCVWGNASDIKLSVEVDPTWDKNSAIEVISNEVDLGYILNSQGSAKSKNPIRIKLNENFLNNHNLRLIIKLKNGEYEQKKQIEFLVKKSGVLTGVITEDMTLTPDQEYIIHSNFGVPEGVTLTISPGTTLKFSEGAAMNVKGNFICHGTPDKPIVFTGYGNIGEISLNGEISYVIFDGLETSIADVECFNRCIIKNCRFREVSQSLKGCNIYNNNFEANVFSPFNRCISTNVVNNVYREGSDGMIPHKSLFSTNIFNNFVFVGLEERKQDFWYYDDGTGVTLAVYTPEYPCYHGTTNENQARIGIMDVNNPIAPCGWNSYNMSNMLVSPVSQAPGIVWKVVVDGFDAQDEFEQMPSLGVGRHKFEVFFNRPMDTRVTPTVRMGAVEPYDQIEINEDGSWNEDRTVYTVYLTIDGKTNADGLNRICVADAVEAFDYYYISEKIKKIADETGQLLHKISIESNRTVDDFWKDFTYFLDFGLNASRFVSCSFNFSSYNIPSKIRISGSNDGVDFNEIQTLSIQESSISHIIDAGVPYCYFRFEFPGVNEENSHFIDNLSIVPLQLTVKDEYKQYLSNNECAEIQGHLYKAVNLLLTENQVVSILQASLNQLYADYDTLTLILAHPTSRQDSVYIPSAPEWVVPVENKRFNVMVAATGSLSTGLMAQAGLGKVILTWETDEEDFEDLFGYNIYRYTKVPDSTYIEFDENWNWVGEWEYFTRMDTIRVNKATIDIHEQQLVDYDVEPGTTYYYYITQMTTSLNSYNLSNVVAATPLTAQKGDANGSMSVDIADVVTEVAYITYQDPQPFIFEAADVNSDQKVNVLDVVGTIGIITTPAEIGVSGIDNEPVRYYVQDGVLYMENTQPLGGVQVRLGVAKGTAITALEALAGMERTSVWTSDSEYLFLAYSMSGRSIPAGTHALLQIGDEVIVTEMVLSDTKGKNITAVDGNATGIGKIEAVQLQMPSPNPFTTVLHVPYTIGKSGSHEVTIAFSDMAGRIIDAYHTVNTPGEYTYTWYPRALEKGLYLVSLYLDGELMQTVKVICNN